MIVIVYGREVKSNLKYAINPNSVRWTKLDSKIRIAVN